MNRDLLKELALMRKQRFQLSWNEQLHKLMSIVEELVKRDKVVDHDWKPPKAVSCPECGSVMDERQLSTHVTNLCREIDVSD